MTWRFWQLDPPIGEPRMYTGTLPMLYPGEVARACIRPEDIQDAVERLAVGGDGEIKVQQWLVEPDKGWKAAYRRWKFTWFSRWFYPLVRKVYKPRPKVTIGGHVEQVRPDGD